MASELRVNTINSRTGFGTITVSETGQDLVGITTIENLTTENTLVGAAASFTGNVQIGGVLTYEDVTNIDSVGLITARQGIEIGARPGVAASISVDGNMIVSGISTIANLYVPDKIIHDGDTNTAIRFPSADTITAETAGSEWFRITSAGNVGVGNRTSSPDANLHVHTSSGESTIHVEGATNGILNLRSHSGDSTVKFSDAAASNVGNINYDHGTDKLSFRVNAGDRFIINSSGQISIGGASNGPPGTPDGNLHIQDASAGSVTASTAGNLAVFEDSASNGISILVPAAERANIYFGTPGTNGEIEAGIQYAHESVSTAADRRDMIFRAGGGEKVRIQGTGGISFNGDNVTANALDDYEEGSWTVAPTCETGSVTLHNQVADCVYVKIGRLVQISGRIRFDSVSGQSGWIRFSLPFTNISSGPDQSSLGQIPVNTHDLNLNSACISTFFELSSGNAFASLVCQQDNGSWFAFNCGDLKNNDNEYIAFSGTYQTDA